jgi:hypothetical protein
MWKRFELVIKSSGNLWRDVLTYLITRFNADKPLVKGYFNPLNAKLNSICHLLALAGAHHFVDVSRIRVKDSLFLVCDAVSLYELFCTCRTTATLSLSKFKQSNRTRILNHTAVQKFNLYFTVAIFLDHYNIWPWRKVNIHLPPEGSYLKHYAL